MENVKHIKNITIENFKCFDYLSVDNFNKYNIILGDNNVGKTSLLEALLFDENISQTIYNFQATLEFKNISFNDVALDILYTLNPFSLFINRYTNKNGIGLKIDYSSGKNVNFFIETVKTDTLASEIRNSLNDFFNNNRSDKEILKVVIDDNNIQYRKFDVSQNYDDYQVFIPYLFSSAYYGNDLLGYYTDNFAESKDKKKSLIKELKSFIPTISDIELTVNFIDNSPIIGIWLSDKDSLLPLLMFGDGTVRLFRIIMEITESRGKYICIDEIDSGIHHSKYKDFSRIVLSSASNNNVQLFITTHNNEFLKAFKEVLEEENFKSYQDETKCFSLKKLPKGDVKAYSYNFDEFEFAIEQENELR